MDIYRPETQISALGTRVDMRAVMQQVYLWMTLGLITSAVVALVFAVTGLTAALGPLLLVAVIAQVGLVWYLAARIHKMEARRAQTMFLLFAGVMGITLSSIFYFASLADIFLALFATSATFGAMTIVGYTTKTDLSKLGGLLFMALIGLIIASVVNIFVASSTLYWIVNYAGVLIFVGLTAYDTQWIKNNAQRIEVQGVSGEAAAVRQVAILGALHLYLDFINLFIFILNIISSGSRR